MISSKYFVTVSTPPVTSRHTLPNGTRPSPEAQVHILAKSSISGLCTIARSSTGTLVWRCGPGVSVSGACIQCGRHSGLYLAGVDIRRGERSVWLMSGTLPVWKTGMVTSSSYHFYFLIFNDCNCGSLFVISLLICWIGFQFAYSCWN